MKKVISNDVSIYTEYDGLFALQDNRNGNLVIMDEQEFRHMINIAQDILDEYELAKGLLPDE